MFEVEQLDIPHVGTSANVLFDNSSSATLITHEYAGVARLQGTPINYYLKATGFPMQQKTTLIYTITMEDRDGRHHYLPALGIDEITDVSR